MGAAENWGVQMKIRFAIVATAAFALTACGGQTKQAPDVPDLSLPPAASSEVVTTPPATPAKGDRPTKDFLIGKWGTNGDCALAIDLRADGTSDGPFGNWSYNDGVISFPEEPDFKVSVTIIDNNTMASTNASSDKASKMTRCP